MLQKKLPLLVLLPQAGATIPPELHAEHWESQPPGAETANRLLRESMDIGDRLECLLAGELSPAVLKLAAGRVKTVLDCFVLPALENRSDRPDPHRIMLVLGNQGDERGEALPHSGPISCPAEWVRDFRDILAARFSDLPGRVGLNTPAPGGHLLRLHARQPVPWIRFGVAPELLNAPEGILRARRPERLRERVEAALVMFCKLQDWI